MMWTLGPWGDLWLVTTGCAIFAASIMPIMAVVHGIAFLVRKVNEKRTAQRLGKIYDCSLGSKRYQPGDSCD